VLITRSGALPIRPASVASEATAGGTRGGGSEGGRHGGAGRGLSGLLVAPVAGYFIQTWGWTADYVMLAAAVALAFVPMLLLRETVHGRFIKHP
jgi:hypothetical protein